MSSPTVFFLSVLIFSLKTRSVRANCFIADFSFTVSSTGPLYLPKCWTKEQQFSSLQIDHVHFLHFFIFCILYFSWFIFTLSLQIWHLTKHLQSHIDLMLPTLLSVLWFLAALNATWKCLSFRKSVSCCKMALLWIRDKTLMVVSIDSKNYNSQCCKTIKLRWISINHLSTQCWSVFRGLLVKPWESLAHVDQPLERLFLGYQAYRRGPGRRYHFTTRCPGCDVAGCGLWCRCPGGSMLCKGVLPGLVGYLVIKLYL